MFFSRKKIQPADLSWLGADMHSHLLPGIDDGSPDLETSLELIRGLQSLGYKKIITTPHILWELYPNTSAVIESELLQLRQAMEEAGMTLEIKAAAEYFMDEHFATELKNKTPLLRIGGNMVLVEFSMLSAPMDLQDILFEMQMQEYQPVLAHPERYSYLLRKTEVLDELKNAGCLFQLNLLSLSGYYGEAVQQLAELLLKKHYYDFAGTDLHHARHLAALKKLPAAQVQKLQDTGHIKNHLL